MRHPLTDPYRRGRQSLLDLGDTISEAEAATMTSACPAWSVKDVYAHLAGISTDILAGNTEGAATPEWADGHVDVRRDDALAAVLTEWQTAGAGVSDVMESVGDAFPFQLFVDQWTHEWDIRAALGERAATTPDLDVFDHYLDQFFEIMQADEQPSCGELVVDLGGRSMTLGKGPSVGTLNLGLFDFARLSMGRRSQSQIDAMPWPDAVADASPYVDVLVRWSVNDRAVVDPVR